MNSGIRRARIAAGIGAVAMVGLAGLLMAASLLLVVRIVRTG